MNLIFSILILASIIIMLFSEPSKILTTMQSGCTKAVELSIELISVYALWLGLLELVDKSSLSQKIAKLLKPIIRLLFTNVDSTTENLIALNIASNILGMGNASTPSGILAMEKFAENSNCEKPNSNMITMVLLNSCAIQIIPSTIIGIRAKYQSQSPSDILLPNILASFITTIFGIFVVLMIERRKK